MVKFDGGKVANGDEADEGRERLFPLPSSSPAAISRHKAANACKQEDGEQEPLLHNICQSLAVNGASRAESTEEASNCESTIPIFITTDRLTLTNPAATASVHSSPSHCRGLVESTNKSVIDLPVAATAALSVGTIGPHRRIHQAASHDEVVSIQLLSGNDVNEARSTVEQESFECSWRGMCGPKPKRMTIFVIVALSVWASFIFGLNVHKQVSSLKTELSTMTDKVQVLHQNYLKMKNEASTEIRHLKNVISDIKVINHKLSQPPDSPPPHQKLSRPPDVVSSF